MNVYVLRHGQTNWNAKQVVQGKMNESHLDETGTKQATVIREKLLNNVFDAVLVSPLHRAQETAKIVNNGIRKYVIDERLTERSYEAVKEKGCSLSAGQYFEIKIKHLDISTDEFEARLASYRNSLSSLFNESHDLEDRILSKFKDLKYDE